MNRAAAVLVLGFVVLPTNGFALSENEHLSCQKELPSPYSLATRRDYVLTCMTKAPALTVTKMTVNQGQCSCRTLRSMENMERGTRIMSICREAGKPCDITDVAFETSAGDFIFSWSPVVDDLDIP